MLIIKLILVLILFIFRPSNWFITNCLLIFNPIVIPVVKYSYLQLMNHCSNIHSESNNIIYGSISQIMMVIYMFVTMITLYFTTFIEFARTFKIVQKTEECALVVYNKINNIDQRCKNWINLKMMNIAKNMGEQAINHLKNNPNLALDALNKMNNLMIPPGQFQPMPNSSDQIQPMLNPSDKFQPMPNPSDMLQLMQNLNKMSPLIAQLDKKHLNQSMRQLKPPIQQLNPPMEQLSNTKFQIDTYDLMDKLIANLTDLKNLNENDKTIRDQMYNDITKFLRSTKTNADIKTNANIKTITETKTKTKKNKMKKSDILKAIKDAENISDEIKK